MTLLPVNYKADKEITLFLEFNDTPSFEGFAVPTIIHTLIPDIILK